MSADVPGKVMPTAYASLMSNSKRNGMSEINSELEHHRLSNVGTSIVDRGTSLLPSLEGC